MRILSESLNGRGYKLQIDNLDDLWHLYNLIERNDIVGSKTYRRLERADDKIRPDKTPKKMVWLALNVEEVEFHEFSNRLRIHGTIIKGPDELGLKSYHTLNFEPGSQIELEKSQAWRPHQLKLLENAVSATNQPKVTIVAIEDDNAVIAQLYQYGIRNLANIDRIGGGKLYDGVKTKKTSGIGSTESKKDFFNNILTQLNQVRPENTPLILVGPGFTKDELLKFCKDKHVPGANEIMLEPTGQGGMTGVQEAIKRGVVKRCVEDSRVVLETELVDKLLESISKNDAVSYGKDETSDAAAVGAVATLLVIDKLIRGKHDDIETIITQTESTGGKVVIVSSVHDAGKQLEALGGIGALLRYKMKNS